MGSILLLMMVVSIAYLFWLQRKQDERATRVAQQLCRQHELQFLECGRMGHRIQRLAGRRRFITCYQVDFSSDGESRYQAELLLNGLHLADFILPPHRI